MKRKKRNTKIKKNEREGKCQCEKVSKAMWVDPATFEVHFVLNCSFTAKCCRIKKMERIAVLIINKAPTQPNTKELKSVEIRRIFLPWNVTWFCQPMDQDTEQWRKNVGLIFLVTYRSYCRRRNVRKFEDYKPKWWCLLDNPSLR